MPWTRYLAMLALFVVAGTSGAPARNAATMSLEIGDSLPEIDFTLTDGTRISREDLLGRYVVIDFWATWCAPCIGAFPKLTELERRFADRPIDFYSVTYEPESKFRPVLEQNPLETTIGVDNDFATYIAFGAWGIPAIYVLDPDGIVVSAIGPDQLTRELLESVLSGEIPDVEQHEGYPDPIGAEEHFRSTLEGD